MGSASAFLTSENQCWMTPPEFMDSLRGEFTFSLDVAASEKSAKAERFYTETNDAFSNDWARDAAGGAAWANVPYGDPRRPVADWVLRAWLFRKKMTTVFLLPLSKMDQPFMHKLVLPYAEVRIVEGRINFLDPETGEPPVKIDETTGKKTKRTNTVGSFLAIFGPAYGPGPLRSHKWRSK